MRRVCMLAACCWALRAQDLAEVLRRLEQVERDNQALRQEVKELREELGRSREATPLAETTLVNKQEIDDLAQSKVEASQKFPVAITGMLLFNAFSNGRASGSSQDPVVAGLAGGRASSGASLRQSILGLTFNGPNLPGGGTVSGSLNMDFYGGSRDAENHVLHLRTAMLDMNWGNTTLSFGQDKPILAPREPDSLAMVGVSPLTAAGDLWDWQPQVRIEQRVHFGESAGLTARLGVFQTSETDAAVPAAYASTLEYARPGYQGRFNFWWSGGERRIEVAPGFHVSDTHVAGTSVPSRIASVDWLVRPAKLVEVTGALFQGGNVAPLGALRQGFRILGPRSAIPIHSTGAWGQTALFVTPRLTLHFYGGAQWGRERDLDSSGVTRNLIYAGNVYYRLAPNVLASFEASQVRTNYLLGGLRLNNHYDLALAYLF